MGCAAAAAGTSPVVLTIDPGWVERGYSPATVEYLTRYIEGAERTVRWWA